MSFMSGPLHFSPSLPPFPPHLHVGPDQPPTRILLEEALQERPENAEKGKDGYIQATSKWGKIEFA